MLTLFSKAKESTIALRAPSATNKPTNDQVEYNKAMVVFYLVILQPKKIHPDLISLLKQFLQKDDIVRVTVARALINVDQPEATEILKKLVFQKYGDWKVRRSALKSLATRQNPTSEVIDIFKHFALRKVEIIELRMIAMMALKRIPNPTADVIKTLQAVEEEWFRYSLLRRQQELDPEPPVKVSDRKISSHQGPMLSREEIDILQQKAQHGSALDDKISAVRSLGNMINLNSKIIPFLVRLLDKLDVNQYRSREHYWYAFEDNWHVGYSLAKSINRLAQGSSWIIMDETSLVSMSTWFTSVSKSDAIQSIDGTQAADRESDALISVHAESSPVSVDVKINPVTIDIAWGNATFKGVIETGRIPLQVIINFFNYVELDKKSAKQFNDFCQELGQDCKTRTQETGRSIFSPTRNKENPWLVKATGNP